MKKATRTVTLGQWLQDFKKAKGEKAYEEIKRKIDHGKTGDSRSAAESAEAPGACLVSNPQSGQLDCIFTTPTSCAAVQGTFIGGPCGATIEKAEDVKSRK